jgi:hypothetical protein
MSARNTTSALAIIALIVSAAPVRAQDTGAPLDVTNVPRSVGTFVPGNVDLQRSPSGMAFGVAPKVADTQSTLHALSENAWDFTNPDSIPGFGFLAPGYDSRRVMPQISGK